MTIEQALKINQDWTPEQAKNDLERLLLRDERPADKAIALACKALEKQMSKKAIYGDDEQDFIRCPNCNYELAYVDDYYYEKYNYCPNCGQKIKWE